MILIFDVLTSILQAFFIAITIHKCLTKQKKSKIILITILIFFISFYFTSKFGNLSLCVLITHLLTILAVALIYKSRKKESIVAFSIAYCFLSLIIIIFWFFKRKSCRKSARNSSNYHDIFNSNNFYNYIFEKYS